MIRLIGMIRATIVVIGTLWGNAATRGRPPQFSPGPALVSPGPGVNSLAGAPEAFVPKDGGPFALRLTVRAAPQDSSPQSTARPMNKPQRFRGTGICRFSHVPVEPALARMPSIFRDGLQSETISAGALRSIRMASSPA